MGTVFLARDPALKRNVVVKVLSPALASDENSRRRFEREAEAAASVAHPNVVSVYQVGQLPKSGTSYFVMQFVDGQTLEAACPPGVPLPEARARRIIGEIAAALSAAHSRGLVHRDIKPANVMLEGESDRVTVLDFGISAAVSPERRSQAGTRLTQQGTSIGTPQYMSPEQAAGEEVTEKSDVYSLGLVAFELLTGRPPFQETNPMALAAAHINRPAPVVASLRPDVDPVVAELVDRCLAKAASARPTGQDVAATLLGTRRQLIEWPPPGLEALRVRARVAHRALSFVALSALLLMAVLAFPPASASANWREGEHGIWRPLAEALAPPAPAGGRVAELTSPGAGGVQLPVDTTPVWLFFIAIAGVLWVTSALWLLTATATLISWAIWSRSAGYPWRAVAAVLIHRGSDEGELINCTGRFGLLDESHRARVRRLRTWRETTTAAGLVWAGMLPIVGPLGLGGLAGHSERLIVGTEFLLMIGPLAALLIAALLTRLQERKLTGLRGGRRALFREAEAPAAPLVAGWLAATGIPQPKGRAPKGRLARRLASWLVVLPAAGVLLAVMAIGVVGVAILGLAVTGHGLGRRAALAWLADSGASSRVREAEAQLLAAGLSDTIGPDASSAARALAASPERQWGYVYPWRTLHPKVLDSLIAELPPSASPPAALRLRAVARGAMLPAAWFATDSSGAWRPARRWELWRLNWAAQTNARLGLASLLLGDAPTAELRAREILAFAAKLGPGDEVRYARNAAAGLGIRLLSDIADRVGNEALRLEAERLQAVQRGLDSTFSLLVSARGALWSAPRTSPLLAVVADRSAPASLRLLAFGGIVAGACFSPREKLFGSDLRRFDALDSAAVLLSDLSDASAIRDLVRWDLEQLRDEPLDLVASVGIQVAYVERLPPFRRPGARVAYCELYNLGWF